jgi:hypothetical protein
VDSLIHKLFSTNQGLHTDTFVSGYKELVMSNACEVFLRNGAVNKEDCERFGDGMIIQGMGFSVTWYHEIMKSLYNYYMVFYNDTSADFKENVPSFGFYLRKIGNGPLQNNGISIIASSSSVNLREF